MKQFDLEAALNGAPVKLRDGRTATVAGYNPDAVEEAQLIGWDSDGDMMSWYKHGVSAMAMDFSEDIEDIIGMAEETHVVNGFEVSKPETAVPPEGSCFYAPELGSSTWYGIHVWTACNSTLDNFFKRGQVFLTPSAAIANAKAMCGIDPNE